MGSNVDTRVIPFDKPLSEGFTKYYYDESCGYELANDLQNTKRFPVDEETLGKPPHVENNIYNFFRCLYNVARGQLLPWIAASQVNLARMSSDDQWSNPFNVIPIIEMIPVEESCVVSISPDLIMPRNEVQKSSLLAPSGAYLTWLEMSGDNSEHDVQ